MLYEVVSDLVCKTMGMAVPMPVGNQSQTLSTRVLGYDMRRNLVERDLSEARGEYPPQIADENRRFWIFIYVYLAKMAANARRFLRDLGHAAQARRILQLHVIPNMLR